MGFKATVRLLSFSSWEFLVLIWSTTEGRKAELDLEPPSGLEHGTHGLEIQRFNHEAIAP